MAAEADIGVMRPQTKEHLEPPEAGTGKEQILPEGLQRECGPADTSVSDFWPSEL